MHLNYLKKGNLILIIKKGEKFYFKVWCKILKIVEINN